MHQTRSCKYCCSERWWPGNYSPCSYTPNTLRLWKTQNFWLYYLLKLFAICLKQWEASVYYILYIDDRHPLNSKIVAFKIKTIKVKSKAVKKIFMSGPTYLPSLPLFLFSCHVSAWLHDWRQVCGRSGHQLLLHHPALTHTHQFITPTHTGSALDSLCPAPPLQGTAPSWPPPPLPPLQLPLSFFQFVNKLFLVHTLLPLLSSPVCLCVQHLGPRQVLKSLLSQ